MPQRIRGIDVRLSSFPEDIGECQANMPAVWQSLNAAQERLLTAKESGSEGWYGTWAESVFSVHHRHPFITCPRGIARIEAIDVCGRPTPVNNSFYEYLLFGNGRMREHEHWRRGRGWWTPNAYQRNNVCTMRDLKAGPQQIFIYVTNPADADATPPKRVLIQGIGSNGAPVITQDGGNTVQGEFVTLTVPFSTTVNSFQGQLTGIQKDVTLGEIQFFQNDPINAGQQDLLLTMEPSETTAWYRRYFLNGLPRNCCPCAVHPHHVLVHALVKLDLVPVTADPDYCVIQSLEALTEEAQSRRYSKIDSAEAKELASYHHAQAIGLLQGQLAHTEGKNEIAINFAPWGTARLERIRIGMK